MTALIIILSALCAVFIALYLTQRRQIKKICRRLVFLKNNRSNMKITYDTPFSEINLLTTEINSLIESCKKTEILSERKDNELKSTITSLSHDIRTPLTSLDGYFQLLKQSKDIKEREKYEKVIQTRITSLRDILEELFTYAKLQDTEYELSLETVNLNKAVCDSLFLFYEELKLKNVEPDINITEEPVSVRANEEALHRVFHNIIKNALEHGGTGNNTKDGISITLVKRVDRVDFICSNIIENADEIDVERVFDRFYKSDSARTQISTGLGLSIAKELTLRMGGDISVNMENSVFTVTVSFKEQKSK